MINASMAPPKNELPEPFLYEITFGDGKLYYGVSSCMTIQRIIDNIKWFSTTERNRPIDYAYRDFGITKVISYATGSLADLRKLKKCLIKDKDTIFPKGYNGLNAMKMEHNKKLHIARRTGKPLSKETRLNQSIAQRKRLDRPQK